MDWPDVAEAFALKAAVQLPTVPGRSSSGRADDAEVKQLLADALGRCRVVVWTSEVLLNLYNAMGISEAAGIAVPAEVRARGMATDVELWVADGGRLVAEIGDTLFSLDGLLVLRGVAPPLAPTDEAGLLVAALIDQMPQILVWWPTDVPLGEVVRLAAQTGVPALPLLMIGHWAGFGLWVRARQGVGVTPVEHAGQTALVLTAPLPEGAVVH